MKLISPLPYVKNRHPWEIAEMNRQGRDIFGIQINKDTTHPIPTGLPSKSVIRWDFEQVVSWLETWVRPLVYLDDLATKIREHIPGERIPMAMPTGCLGSMSFFCAQRELPMAQATTIGH